jgi:hypothetical protein
MKEGYAERQQQKQLQDQEQRRKNFFQRKRFVNYEMQQPPENSDNEEPEMVTGSAHK